MPSPPAGLTDPEFVRAYESFQAEIDPAAIDALQPLGPAAVYTASAVVHPLILQRLAGDASLRQVVADLVARPDALPDNWRVAAGALSANTAAYCRGRTRLDVAVTRELADRTAARLIAARPPPFAGRRVFLFGGRPYHSRTPPPCAAPSRRAATSTARVIGCSAVWSWPTNLPAAATSARMGAIERPRRGRRSRTGRAAVAADPREFRAAGRRSKPRKRPPRPPGRWAPATVNEPGPAWAAVYHRRQDVETDIRDVKRLLKMDGTRVLTAAI